MAKGTIDKRAEESRKRGRPKKTASAENANAGETSGDAVAAKKPKQTRKSVAERAAEKEAVDKEAAKGARKALRKAVKIAVKKQCDKIARALVEGTEKGNMRSTALMLSMIEKNKSDEGSKRHGGLTTADLLGSEEEWEGETAEAVETQGLKDQG